MDQITPKPDPDWELITELGGPTKVAELLKDEADCSVQRVQNWKFRGIPASVKLKRPDLFLRDWTVPAPTEPAKAQA
jgi:hypothetical protein